jgi:hypothetical protein
MCTYPAFIWVSFLSQICNSFACTPKMNKVTLSRRTKRRLEPQETWGTFTESFCSGVHLGPRKSFRSGRNSSFDTSLHEAPSSQHSQNSQIRSLRRVTGHRHHRYERVTGSVTLVVARETRDPVTGCWQTASAGLSRGFVPQRHEPGGCSALSLSLQLETTARLAGCLLYM